MHTLPIVAMSAVRQAFLRDTGAKYNSIVYYSKPADWKFQTTKPNASTHYIYSAHGGGYRQRWQSLGHNRHWLATLCRPKQLAPGECGLKCATNDIVEPDSSIISEVYNRRLAVGEGVG